MSRTLYLVLLLITVTVSSVYSQQLSVKSFRALPNDMDARQNFREMDQNGELCAIVKVVTPESSFQFEIGSLGITKTEQKTGEIWLFIPHGAKRLSIFHKSLGVLRDYFFPERIDEGVCYELVLVSGKTVTTVVANEIESQWLIITSEPTGADVFINDEPAGVTPYQNLLPVGKYNYRLQKTLYLNSAGVVELVSGGQKQKINAKLEPNFGTIDVTSSPERGASVLLSDRVVMLTNGPAATIGEILDVKLEHPRNRLALANDPHFVECRAAILEFLYQKQLKKAA